jgi:hypothetical protein
VNNSDERDYAEEAASRRLMHEEGDAPAVSPAQVRCPICHAGPGWYCRDLQAEGSPVLDEPHLNRVALAEQTPVGTDRLTPDPGRAVFTAALRELAGFIDAHPDLPLPSRAKVSPYLHGTDEEDRAEVDRIAGILGAQPETTPGGHYQVSRTFGGRVSYEATAIPDQQMQDWDALMSYRTAVTNHGPVVEEGTVR